MRDLMAVVAAAALALSGCSSSSNGSTSTRAGSPTPSSTPSTAPLPPGVVAAIHTGESSESAVSAFGSIWVENHRPGTVTRIDPASNTVVATIDVHGGHIEPPLPVGGRLWIAAVDTHTVTSIDPATNQTGPVLTCQQCSEDEWQVTTVGGQLWLLPDRSTLWRIDPVSGKVIARSHITPVSGLIRLGTRLYSFSEDKVLTELNPSTLRPVRSKSLAPLLGDGPIDTDVVGATLWLAASDGTIISYDASRNAVTKLGKPDLGPEPHASDQPVLITVTAQAIYLRPSPQVIVHVDPSNGRVVKRFEKLPSGEYPGYLLSANGSLWAPNWSDESVWRISRDAI